MKHVDDKASILRMIEINKERRQLEDAGLWNHEAYEKLYKEWLDVCGEDGDAGDSFRHFEPPLTGYEIKFPRHA